MLRADETDVLLAIRVTTRAAKDAVVGERAGRLRVSVRAAPTEGEANAAIVKVLAKALSVPKSSVAIVRGARGREKSVRVRGLSVEAARARLNL